MDKNKAFGTCQNEDVIDEIFGSVTEFARQVEENGNKFNFNGVRVDYDETEDIHYFFYFLI